MLFPDSFKQIYLSCVLATIIFFAQPGSSIAKSSYVGPTGYLTIPSNKVVKSGSVEVSSHFRPYKNPAGHGFYEWSMKANFGVKDLIEFGIENTVDNEQLSKDLTPVIHFKMKLSKEHHRNLQNFAAGLTIETDEDNYSSAYLLYRNIGLAFNFGGVAKRGIARFGGYDRDKGEPAPIALLIGLDTRDDLQLDTWMGRILVDYNGDFFSTGLLFDFSKDFKGEIVYSSPSDYDHLRERSPLWVSLSRRF